MISNVSDEDENVQNSYSNYNPLRAINVYSIFLPVCSLAYDHIILKIMNRREHKFARITKYTCIGIYWMLILFTCILFYNDPIEQVIIKQEIYHDNSGSQDNAYKEIMEDGVIDDSQAA